MSLTYFWLAKLFILNVYFHLTIWRRSNQLLMNEFLEVRMKGHECDLGCKYYKRKQRFKLQMQSRFDSHQVLQGLACCLCSSCARLIVSFLSSIFQGENLARTNMIDLSGKVAPLWRDRDCRRASFPWQRHHCTWGLFIILAFQFLFNRAKKIRWFKDFQCSSSSLKRMLPGITTCLISDFQRGEHQLHHAPERN